MKEKRNKSIMRILIRDSIPVGYAVLAAAHASLGGYLTFLDFKYGFASDSIEEWQKESFCKVVCKVNDVEFNEAKNYGVAGVDYKVMTESSLGNQEVAIVFKPRDNWEPFFKKLSLYK